MTKGKNMEKFTIELPFLFGDHHVIEIRKLLGELPGIGDIYVSSSFNTAEITYDPSVTEPAKIKDCLEKAGYVEDVFIPVEIGVSVAAEKMNSPYFRRTNSFETTRKVVSFTQTVTTPNHKKWPFPGIGFNKSDE